MFRTKTLADAHERGLRDGRSGKPINPTIYGEAGAQWRLRPLNWCYRAGYYEGRRQNDEAPAPKGGQGTV